MTRAPAVRNLLIAAFAAVTGLAIGATFSPTMAAWVDLGGSSMTITSIEEPPPSVIDPVQEAPGTTFKSGPTWTGPGQDPDPKPTNSCFTVLITSTSATPVTWKVLMFTGQPPFNNASPFTGFQGTMFAEIGFFVYTPALGYETSGIIEMTPFAEDQWVWEGHDFLAKVCVVNTPEPAWQPPGPDTYVQRDAIQLIRSGSQPCVGVTVDGKQEFFVGFTASFDWKLFLDEQLALATITQAEYNQWINYTHWAGAAPGIVEGSQGATGTDYLVTLTGYSESGRNVERQRAVTISSCSY